MARQTRPLYAITGLLNLKERLSVHRNALTIRLRNTIDIFELDDTNFEAAVEIRDTAQHLVSTVLAMSDLDTTIRLSKLKGKQQCVTFSLANLGMKE